MVRILTMIAGLIVLIIGAILLPTPVPLGIILIPIGFVMMMSASPQLQGVMRRARIRWPKFDNWLKRSGKYLPNYFRKQIELTEPVTDPQSQEQQSQT